MGVEPEHQRGHLGGFPSDAHACHHAVRRPLVLDLQHRARPGLVAELTALRHNTVEAAAAEVLEPRRCQPAIAGRRREENGRGSGAKHVAQPPPALDEGRLAQVLAVQRGQVERDVDRRCANRQLA